LAGKIQPAGQMLDTPALCDYMFPTKCVSIRWKDIGCQGLATNHWQSRYQKKLGNVITRPRNNLELKTYQRRCCCRPGRPNFNV